MPISEFLSRSGRSVSGWCFILLVALLLLPVPLVAQLPHLSHISVPVNSGILRGTVTIDLDGDGFLDLATVNGDGLITLLWNPGNGLFANRQTLSPGNGVDGLVRGIVAGDVDNDGDDDLAFFWAPTSGTGGYLSIRRNLAPGIFAPRQDVPLDLLEVFTPYEVELIDIDSDGFLDIVAATNQHHLFEIPASITVVLCQGLDASGEPLFGNPQHRFSLFYTEYLRVADYDSDGDLDIAISHEISESISFFFNNGSGAFSVASTFEISSNNSGPKSMTADDYDQNGTIDLLVSNVYSKTFSFLAGNGDGTFEDGGSFTTGQLGFGVQGFHSVGDLDGDGDLDLVIPYTGSLMKVHYNDGSGDFSAESIMVTDPTTGKSILADIDGDLILDIILEMGGSSRICIRTASPASAVHVESMRAVRGGLLHLPILVGANMDIEAFSFGAFLDDSLLAPLTLEPGFHLLDETAGIGPEFWLVDLLVPGGGISVDCVISSVPGGPVLPAGRLYQAAEVLLGVSNVPVPTLTPVIPTDGTAVPALAILEGQQPVVPSLSGALIEIIVPLQFVRGDVNENGLVNIGDAALLLRRMFLGATPGSCTAAEDVNKNGIVSLSDPLHLLYFLFQGSIPPVEPFPICGISPDPLAPGEGCTSYSLCP